MDLFETPLEKPDVESVLSPIEWGWSLWLVLLIPAILSLSVGLFIGRRKRPVRLQTIFLVATTLFFGASFYFLWIFHVERIDRAKVDYFMKYENPPNFSWTGEKYDEPVYDDWSTTGDKGFYVKCRNKEGSLYVRPPHWVIPVAIAYCAFFSTAGYLLIPRQSGQLEQEQIDKEQVLGKDNTND